MNEKTTPELTPKGKAHFEEWLLNGHLKDIHGPEIALKFFYALPFAFQQGVYLEYLRKKGMEVQIHRDISGKHHFSEVCLYPPQFPFFDSFETSFTDDAPTAIVAAIEAAFSRLEQEGEKQNELNY